MPWKSAFADAAYPISRVLMKPFTNNKISNDLRKLLFNRRLSGLQTAMSEYVFGRWVRRFPNIKDLKTFLTQLQKTILATAILQNIAMHWDEDDVGVTDDGAHDDKDGGGGGDERGIDARTARQMSRQTLLDMPA